MAVEIGMEGLSGLCRREESACGGARGSGLCKPIPIVKTASSLCVVEWTYCRSEKPQRRLNDNWQRRCEREVW